MQVKFLLDVSNFSVVLLIPENGKLEISLLYENDVRQEPRQTQADMGIEKFLTSQDSGIFWPQDVPVYLKKYCGKLTAF